MRHRAPAGPRSTAPFGVDPDFSPASAMYMPGLNVSDYYLPSELNSFGLPLGFFHEPVPGAPPHKLAQPDARSRAIRCAISRNPIRDLMHTWPLQLISGSQLPIVAPLLLFCLYLSLLPPSAAAERPPAPPRPPSAHSPLCLPVLRQPAVLQPATRNHGRIPRRLPRDHRARNVV